MAVYQRRWVVVFVGKHDGYYYDISVSYVLFGYKSLMRMQKIEQVINQVVGNKMSWMQVVGEEEKPWLFTIWEEQTNGDARATATKA